MRLRLWWCLQFAHMLGMRTCKPCPEGASQAQQGSSRCHNWFVSASACPPLSKPCPFIASIDDRAPLLVITPSRDLNLV